MRKKVLLIESINGHDTETAADDDEAAEVVEDALENDKMVTLDNGDGNPTTITEPPKEEDWKGVFGAPKEAIKEQMKNSERAVITGKSKGG